ncbi:type I-MYXAN CRISPR-associated protein Cas6/Cmx6 [Vitiosangium sp. GDMCC 1.1324]|uniref:type I-MYXAN CRISPR-associated protein Cas6/Cmx6 n=1 Tax=Vitiosangium sp. (strain GDMCC 1.1324) TaxID=2138576 RepID=UPI000D384E94|nr:type I-MYXAN CRISPR-associated protein Cas6/Cmx6 [Vitiosangium sp. GDMCC 1.1324]PTL82517.1 type I-MYXAN CRISPR-associated protein Cas6/Cmx6 [Vitiosangium sp. GDMCC 1.1324]
MTSPVIDILFPVRGGPVPLDHGYLLFSALSRRLPGLHERHDVGVFTLRGTRADAQVLHLGRGALRLRCPADSLAFFLPLACSALVLAGREVRLGRPEIHPLAAAPSLSARLVTFKHALDAATFELSTRKFLRELRCEGTLTLGRRRILSIAGRKVVGFALTVGGLAPEDSLRLQTQGLGGRRHLGCGLFLPTRHEEVRDGQGLEYEMPSEKGGGLSPAPPRCSPRPPFNPLASVR